MTLFLQFGLFGPWNPVSDDDFDEDEIRKETLRRKRMGFLDKSIGKELDITIALDRNVKRKKREL